MPQQTSTCLGKSLLLLMGSLNMYVLCWNDRICPPIEQPYPDVDCSVTRSSQAGSLFLSSPILGHS
ncbi:hypothetical protein MANES_14G150700v8 [Manihot esculenta]|uniref:Secreted protein n=1 Tax=Manihot esculenta TaxID=3983 RepID=A0A2C9UMU7_MANES|nr:hypothetical protein MANES_14G150700v8 [Manihot esculenta]